MRIRLCSIAAPAAALALLCAVHTSAVAQPGGRPGEPPPSAAPGNPAPYPRIEGAQADSVRDALRAYLEAVVRSDGPAAARLVTRSTRAYYARMRDMAVSAPEAQVRAAPLMDRLSILLMRHRIPADVLRGLAGDAVFAHTVTDGWMSETAGTPPPVNGDVYGEGDRAFLSLGAEDVHLVREEGAWRWDMTPMLQAASAEMAPGPDSGMTEDEFLMFVLRYATGRDPSPDIWQPLQ